MPMLEGCYEYYSRGEMDIVDIVGRPSVLLWNELVRLGKARRSGGSSGLAPQDVLV